MNISNQTGEGEIKELQSAETALKQLSNIQSLIDIMTTKLVEFRCLGLNEFTLKEIRRLEGKLIKHFSQQLEAKHKVNPSDILADLHHYPSMSKWLTVVGVSSLLANALKNRGCSVEDLMDLSEIQLQSIITDIGGSSEDDRKLISSLTQLKRFQDTRKNNIKNIDTTDIYWDSWSKVPDEDVFDVDESNDHDVNENLSNHKPYIENGSYMNNDHSRNGSESSGSLPSDSSRTRSNTDPSNADLPPGIFPDTQGHHNRQIPSTSSSCLTPPSPSYSLDSDFGPSVTRNTASSSPPPHASKMFAIPPSTASNTICAPTPPVTPSTTHKSPQLLVQSTSGTSSTNNKIMTRERVSSTGAGTALVRPNKLNSNMLLPPFNKLKPSKSSEWHIGNHILPNTLNSDNMTSSNQSLTSITTLPPPATTKHFSTKPTKKNKKRPGNLVLSDSDVPNFIHISRTASRRSSTTVSPESALCSSASPLSPRTPMTPATPCNQDMWCRDREVHAYAIQSPHTPKTPKSGLKSIKAFFARISRKPKLKRNKSTDQILDEDGRPQTPQATFHHESPRRRSDTLPSATPQLSSGMFQASSTYSGESVTPEINKFPYHAPLRSASGDFRPEASSASSSRPGSFIDTDRTLTCGTDMSDGDNAGTLVHDSPNEGDLEEESTLTDDGDEPGESVITRANLFRQESTMQSMSEEWDIPYGELEFNEKIGRGRVGTVHRGHWHGDVAIRVIDINHNDEDKLRAFKQEIMIYKKTRHENLELFMGSCMHPPHLAIVSGFCKGNSLYNYIRGSKNQSINVNQAKIIAQHIVQGMGYLHSKGIIHKDLKSKNIFVDGKRVVITGFGLVGLHAVSGDNVGTVPGTLVIPDGWLCYLAPEVIKALRFPLSDSDDVISTLPYTMKSDVFAFGTVWYELLSGSWPFNGFPAESIIWQAGYGKKQNLSQLQGFKDLIVKDVLMQSWAYDPARRPDFSDSGIMGTLKKLQTQIHRGNSDPSMTTIARSLPRPSQRYHPLLSPIPNSASFELGTTKY